MIANPIASPANTIEVSPDKFHTPDVKNKDIGRNSIGLHPFILSMSPGRDDYIILLVGESEKAKILLESKDLLADLRMLDWNSRSAFRRPAPV